MADGRWLESPRNASIDGLRLTFSGEELRKLLDHSGKSGHLGAECGTAVAARSPQDADDHFVVIERVLIRALCGQPCAIPCGSASVRGRGCRVAKATASS